MSVELPEPTESLLDVAERQAVEKIKARRLLFPKTGPTPAHILRERIKSWREGK